MSKQKPEITWIGKDKRPKLAHSLWLVLGRNIKRVRRTAATAPTLEEKLAHQKQQRELEGKRSKLRRELFDRQDEIEAQRNGLIEQLEVQVQQQVEERTLFTVEWELK